LSQFLAMRVEKKEKKPKKEEKQEKSKERKEHVSTKIHKEDKEVQEVQEDEGFIFQKKDHSLAKQPTSLKERMEEKKEKKEKKGEHVSTKIHKEDKEDKEVQDEAFFFHTKDYSVAKEPTILAKKPPSLTERMAANIRNGRRLLTAKTARAKKALGSAAAQVKPLSASKDFHDELSSVRAVAGKLLDGEGTQTQTLAQKAPSDILPDQPPPQQPPQVAQAAQVVAQAQKTPAPAVAVPAVAMPAVAVPAVPTQSATPIVDPATLQAPPGMPAKRAHVWLKKHRAMLMKQNKQKMLTDRRLADSEAQLNKLIKPDEFGEAWHARMVQVDKPKVVPVLNATDHYAKRIVHAEKKAMQKAQTSRTKNDFWGFITGAITTKTAQEQTAADNAEKEAQGIEVTEDPEAQGVEPTEESTQFAEESTESTGNRRRRLSGVGQEHVGQDLEEVGALEAILAKRSQGW